jgi:hypothetical protein
MMMNGQLAAEKNKQAPAQDLCRQHTMVGNDKDV